MTVSGLPRLVDIKVLAEHLGVAPRHVRRLVDEGRIPIVRWGRLIRFDPEEVTAWLEGARVPALETKRRPTSPGGSKGIAVPKATD
jgi:excisionase family DNA binding protein